MSDIELVIKIPEELKNKIDNANEDNYRTYIWWFETTLYCAIKHGIPLPKGHGELKDTDELLKNAFIREDEEGNIFVKKYYCIKQKDFDCVPTIIEADKS